MDVGLIKSLAVALGLGVVVGMERGFRTRGEDVRALGTRTFALGGLTSSTVVTLAFARASWARASRSPAPRCPCGSRSRSG